MPNREYGVDNGDGTITVWGTDDAGNFWKIRTEPSSTNQGTPRVTQPTGQLYDGKSIDEIRQLMNQASGGNSYSNMDPASLIAAWRNVKAGRNADGSAVTGARAGAGGINGGTALIDNVATSNADDHALAHDKFDWDKLTQAQQLALQALGVASEYANSPKDYFKFNQYTSGGKDIFAQLNSSVPRAAFSAPTGPIEPGSLADALKALGIDFGGGTGSATGGADANTALDAIWAAHPEFTEFYRSNGWQIDTPEQKRAAVTNWLTVNNFDDIIAAGRDPVKFAQAKGYLTAPVAAPATTPESAQATAPAANSLTAAATAPQAAVAPESASMTAQGVTAGATAKPPIVPSTTRTIDGLVSANKPPIVPPTTRTIDGTVPYTQPATPTVPTTPAPVTPTTPVAATTPAAPLWGSTTLSGNTYPITAPYQINPGVWDSLGPVGQSLALGAAKAAGWDENEYLYQLNASRPQGTAPRQTRTQWSNPKGVF